MMICSPKAFTDARRHADIQFHSVSVSCLSVARVNVNTIEAGNTSYIRSKSYPPYKNVVCSIERKSPSIIGRQGTLNKVVKEREKKLFAHTLPQFHKLCS